MGLNMHCLCSMILSRLLQSPPAQATSKDLGTAVRSCPTRWDLRRTSRSMHCSC